MPTIVKPTCLQKRTQYQMHHMTGALKYVRLGMKGKGKDQNIALKERTPHRATERHLSYGITQCYLPPDRGERTPP